MWNKPPSVVKLNEDLQESELRYLCRDYEQLVNAAHVYKQCQARWVGRIDLPSQTLVMKAYHERSIRHRTRQYFQVSRALRNASHTLRMIDLGLSTPRPLACLEERWGPFRGKSCLLTEFIGGPILSQYEDLLRLVTETHPSRNPIDVVIEQLRDVRQMLLELTLHHHDVHGGNFIFDESGKLHLLDIESIRATWTPGRSENVVNAKFDMVEASIIKQFARASSAAMDKPKAA